MKTKHFLTALALPLAFAACTNEDFVSESSSLETRGTVDVTITATRPSLEADTRMSIDENSRFVWETTDLLGAALVDGANFGTINGDNAVQSNYPFTADGEGNVSTFSGKSSLTKGFYFFYYPYTDVLGRTGLTLDMPEQVYDVANKKSSFEQAASYMKIVSPIVNLAKGVGYEAAQKYNLNLKFANLYTFVRVDIKSSNIPNDAAPKVTKITLDGKTAIGGTSSFKKDAIADMCVIGDKSTSNKNVVTLDKNGQINGDEQTDALEALEKLIASGEIYNDKNATGATATVGAYELKVKGDVALATTNTTSLYILVPKGKYNQLDLTVETSEGSYTKTVTNNNGIELGNKQQPISADLNFATDGTGNVILPKTFNIASTDDWNNAIQFMTDHAVGYLNKSDIKFNLTKSIEIESLPVFNLAIEAVANCEEGHNPILTLKSNYTINGDNKDQFSLANVTLAVASGATLTLNEQPTGITTLIENYGTLNIAAATLSNPINNYATLNVTTTSALSGNLNNGQAEDKSNNVPEIPGIINVTASTKTITVTSLTNIVGAVNVAANTTLSGITLTNNAKGKIEVKGILTGTSVTNSGEIDNFGSLQVGITNTDGKFIIEKGSSAKNSNSTITNGTVEVKDVASFSAAQTDLNNVANNIIYNFGGDTKVTAKVTNAKEYAAADAAKVTDITLNGGDWTITGVAGSDTGKIVMAPSNAKGLILNGANLSLNTATLNKNISADGNSTVKTNSTAKITGAVTVNKGAVLTVSNGITVNTQNAVASTEIATVNGSLTVAAGAKMYFKSANVGEGASVTVAGETDAAAAEFGVVTGAFTNNGTVTSAAATKQGGGDAGKVTQPTNGAKGTFKGNATPSVDATAA